MADRPRVFLDVSIGEEPIGRLIIELFADKTPKTCENFRIICTGANPPLTYKLSTFHRIIDEFMIQGGDITKGNGTGGTSIYGPEFEDESIGWRNIDKEGLLCMANRGKDTNSSQFFITLAPCPHLNAKHTVFGHVVSGNEAIKRMAKVDVDKEDVPLKSVIISHCGELERKKNPAASIEATKKDEHANSISRGRYKRRRSSTPNRSPSPSREHTRESGSRHRHRRHRKEENLSKSGGSSPEFAQDRRRSVASPDHNLRGRGRQRSRSRSGSRSLIAEDNEASPARKHRRKRSPPPSRSRVTDPSNRRQRSLPNQYQDWREEERLRSTELARDGNRFVEDSSARLGGRNGGQDDSEVKYKGRGAMKYREQQKQRWR